MTGTSVSEEARRVRSYEAKDILVWRRRYFCPTRKISLNEKKYGLAIIDDFSRFAWVKYIAHKDESFKVFTNFCKVVQNEKECCVSKVRSNHGISHDFSCPRMPQQNGFVKRKNKTLKEMVRTMLHE